jgi:flagellar hook-associated protein 3 FlgL
MSVRITALMPQQQILENLTSTMNTILQQQNEVATGSILSEPSDNPGAVAQDLVVNQALSQVNSWSKVAQSALTVAQGADQAMTQIESAADTAYTAGESLLSGAGQTEAPAVAQQLSGYLTAVGQLANTQVSGIYVLGGDSGTPPWSSTTPTVAQSGSPMMVTIGNNLSVPQNVDGAQTVSGILQGIDGVMKAVQAPSAGQAYHVTVTYTYASGSSYATSTTYTSTNPPGTVSAGLPAGAPAGPPTSITATFAVGTTPVDTMTVSSSSFAAGTGVSFTAPGWSQMVSGSLGLLQTAQQNLIAAHSQFGTQMQRIQAAESALASQSTQLTSTRATLDSASIPTVIANLSMEESAYQAILNTSQTVLLPTLASYLKQIG